jgi:hypothetical protein
MTRKLCQILGVVFLLVGAAGFVKPDLLGMHLTPVHNIIHLVSGGLALYFGNVAPQNARAFCGVFGTVYLLLGVAGMVAPDLVGSVIGHPPLGDPQALMPDNVVHILLGGVFVFAALATAGIGAMPTHKTTS